MLENNADINIQDNDGDTPLFYAETISSIRFLKLNRADFSIKNNSNLSSDEKNKILTIIKESFGTLNSPIKDQVNKLID